MAGQTVAEKLISAHTGKRVQANELAIVQVDGAMATDTTGPLAIRAFERMGGQRLWQPERFSLVIDHASPAPNEQISNLHKLLREFAQAQGCHFYDVGVGICHQVMIEEGHVRPGDLFTGADSHTPSYGALNAFAVGMGSTDLAAVMLTGQTWLKVPDTLLVRLEGELPPGLSAKDLILHIVGQVGVSGAIYMAIEYTGPVVAQLSLAGRIVLANMAAEMGAKTALVDPTGLQLDDDDWQPTFADNDAHYARTLTVDVSQLTPLVAVPHAPDRVVPIAEVAGTKIQQAFIGSCTNARLEDLQAAAAVLKGRQVAAGVRLLIAPASRRVFNAALADGTIAILSAAGASFITSGCGPCVGTHNGVPADGEVIISSTNRNFRGRMGNPNAEIYLASPASVAAAALTGEITPPATVLAQDWELR